jgi:hypothetical protein
MHQPLLWIWSNVRAEEMVKPGTGGQTPMGVKEGSVLTIDITILGQRISKM